MSSTLLIRFFLVLFAVLLLETPMLLLAIATAVKDNLTASAWM